MNIAGLLFMIVAHYLTGKGLLKLFKIELRPVPAFCLSIMAGVPLLSFVPCFIQLLTIPITALSVLIGVVVLTSLFSIPLLIKFKRPTFSKITFPKIYEWPFLIVCLFLMGFSIWRCFYYPPYSRDALSGPELIAEYAVREQTMINSVFNIDLSTSNNYFKSPYLTGLQIIYKLLVCPFGQVWLSLLFIGFTGWLYVMLHERLHPILASGLLLLFFGMPEPFSYTFMILYDYSNMIFFFLGFYFLAQYLEHNQLNHFTFSALLFGLATYIRTETLILVAMLVPLLIVYAYRNRTPLKTAIYRIGLFVIVPAAFYLLCIDVFVRLFIPLPFDLATQINPNLSDVSFILQRLQGMNRDLLFSDHGIALFGYFIVTFCGLLITDIIWPRLFNRASLIALYGIAVVYFGLAFIGYLLPLADLENTTKRGLFKLLPIILLYMSNSGMLIYISGRISGWEYSNPLLKKQDSSRGVK
jgi:hypothetical protein